MASKGQPWVSLRTYRGWTLNVERVEGARFKKFRGEAICGLQNVTARDCESQETMFEVLENVVDAYLQGQEDLRDDVLGASIDEVITVTLRWGHNDADVFEMYPDTKVIGEHLLTVRGVLKRNETVYEACEVSIPFTLGRQYPEVGERIPGSEEEL